MSTSVLLQGRCCLGFGGAQLQPTLLFAQQVHRVEGCIAGAEPAYLHKVA